MPVNYRNDIDGLRAIAVASVFLYHLGVSWMPGGFVGVDVFFVISGYLITGIIYKGVLNNQFSLIGFYAKRVRRIFPALFLVLVVSAAAAILILMPLEYQLFFNAFKYAAQQLSNFLFVRGVNYFDANHITSPLLHTWSLAVEEQFYLFWPLILMATAKFLSLRWLPLLIVFVLIGSLVNSEYLLNTNPKQAFYFLNSRAWELALGGVIACNVIPHIKSEKLNGLIATIGLILITVSLLMFNNETRFPGVNAFIPCLGTVLVIYSGAAGGSLVHRFLSIKPFIFFGLISYSLYLWHWPIIVFWGIYNPNPISNMDSVIIIILSVLLSYLSWRFVENPFRQKTSSSSVLVSDDFDDGLRHGMSAEKKAVYTALAMIVVFTILAELLKAQSHSRWRFNTDIYPQFSDWDEYLDECNYRGSHMRKGTVPDAIHCTKGLNQQNPEVLLIGDSHAAHYFAGVIDWADKRGMSVRLLSSLGCPALIGDFEVIKRAGGILEKCRGFSDAIEDYIVKNNSIQYVFMGMRMDLYTSSDELKLVDGGDRSFTTENSRRVFRESLAFSLSTFQRHRLEVVILGQTPLLAQNPLDCHLKDKVLLSYVIPLNREIKSCFSFDTELYEKKMAYALDALENMGLKFTFSYFDPVRYLPYAYKDEYILYRDADHLNEIGSRYLGQFIAF